MPQQRHRAHLRQPQRRPVPQSAHGDQQPQPRRQRQAWQVVVQMLVLQLRMLLMLLVLKVLVLVVATAPQRTTHQALSSNPAVC